MARNNSLGLDQPIAHISQSALLVSPGRLDTNFKAKYLPKVQIAIWTLVAFALILLLARIAINLHALRRLQVADGFATFAFALLAINGVCCFVVTKDGDLPPASGLEAKQAQC